MRIEVKKLIEEGSSSLLLTDEGERGVTGEVNLLKYSDLKYILRRCKTKDRADRYEKFSKLFEKHGWLPKFLGREGNDILYEFIEGRDLQKDESDEVILQIGEILAKVNEENYTGDFSFSYFEDYLIYLGFDTEEHTKLKNAFFNLVELNRPEIRLDVSDPSPENFRLREGKAYLVDIDSIHLDIKGAGIGKCFFKWFRDDVKRGVFFKGYSKILPNDFLTSSYLDMLTLNFIITNLRVNKKYKVRLESVEKLKKGLERFLIS